MSTNNAIDNPGNLFLVPNNNLSDVTNKVTSSYNLNTAGYYVFAISGATLLTAANFGQQVVCTGATAYSVTLPTVVSNANKYIDFSIRTTAFALVTITPASGLINGQSFIILGSNESCRLETDGTNWYLSNLFMQPVNMKVMLSAPQLISDSTVTKVNFDSVAFDVGGFYDNVTNFRYLPLYPGKYSINSSITYENTAAPANESIYIYINGTPAYANITTVDTNIVTSSLNAVEDFIFNGSTTYAEIFTDQNSGSSLNIQIGASPILCISRTSLF